MATYKLPDNLAQKKPEGDEKIIFHKYSPVAVAVKTKSILAKNLISLLIEGEKTIHFANEMLTITNEQFLMISTGNFLSSEKRPSRYGRFSSILIFFDNSVLNDFKIKHAELIQKSLAKNAAKRSHLALQKDDFIKNYIQSLQLIMDKNIPLSDAMKQIKLEELFLYLLQTKPDLFLSFQSLSKKESESLEIRRAVEANITNNITLEELAFLCNMSLSTFKRHFAQLYKTPPNKWLLQRRMEIAKSLLAQAGQKPSDVYHQLGYENHSSFTETFKQTYGLTPKQFQLQNMN